jgi:parallel beta-helix repeat protein
MSFRHNLSQFWVVISGLTSLLWIIPHAHAAASLELYGTFHAMGVIVTMDPSDDPDADAVAAVTYRSGSDAYKTGFPLSRVSSTRWVGSLFWLDPGTGYDVRVTITDPDHGPLDQATLQSSMATRSEIVVPAPVDSHYVSPTGNGTACTQGTPCSLTEGLNQADAGDEVVLQGGTYAMGNIDLPRSGSEGAPIVIRGSDAETPVLDGADPDAFTWTASGSGTYSTTAHATDTHLVLADGQRLFPYESLNDLINLSWDDTPGFYQDGATLYVHLKNDKNPNTAAMVISRFGTAFTVTQNYIYFINLTFKHYGQGSYPKVIYLDTASDNLVRGCTFVDNDLGVGIKRASHRNVIEDNQFSDSIFDWPWDGIKGVGGLEDGGVAFYDPATGRGTIIRRNIFHDDFDGLGVCPSATAALTNETDVYDNLIYRMGDDGLETDGQCSNVRIWGNTFHDVLMGISLAPVYGGPVYAIRNLIYRTGVGNNDYSGSPFKFNSGYDLSGPMYLFHNTSDAALPGNNGLYIKAPGTWSRIYARNNIWAGTDYAVNDYNTSQPLDLDYDNLYNAGLNDLVRWDNTRYPSLDAFSTATGQEKNGLNVDPGFFDSIHENYALNPASDLVNAGTLIPGINDNYSGYAPDIGAFECDTGNSAPVAVNDVSATGADTPVTINVIANDSDADGDPLEVENFSAASAHGGTVTAQDADHLTYMPASEFIGTDTFTYIATDGQDDSNAAVVTITVTTAGSVDGTANNGSTDSGSGGGGGCFIYMLRQEACKDVPMIDKFVKSSKTAFNVIPAKAGIK